MSGPTIILSNDLARQRAAKWCLTAPQNSRVEYKPPKRTLPQNSRMWACLTDIARQVEWYGQKLTADDWKDMFTASLRKARVVPGLDPGSFVLLGLHTSDMGKEEMGNLMELIDAFAAERGVVYHWEAEVAA